MIAIPYLFCLRRKLDGFPAVSSLLVRYSYLLEKDIAINCLLQCHLISLGKDYGSIRAAEMLFLHCFFHCDQNTNKNGVSKNQQVRIWNQF